MERAALIISISLGIISIGSIVFYAGYNFRTLQALRKTAHDLNDWRQDLMGQLDLRYIPREVFEAKMNAIGKEVNSIYRIVERREHDRDDLVT